MTRCFHTILLILALLLMSNGCRTQHKTEATNLSSAKDDPSDILARHLTRRIAALTQQIGKLKNEIVDHDNRCLQEQLAALEGHSVRHTKPNRAKDTDALLKRLSEGLDLEAQSLLDSQAAISDHNRKHPEAPWAGVEDVLRLICGDCSQQRAFRDAQLKDEAEKRH